jgi:hypothetical protein
VVEIFNIVFSKLFWYLACRHEFVCRRVIRPFPTAWDLLWYNFQSYHMMLRIYITMLTLGYNDRTPNNVFLAESLSRLQQSIQIKNLACNNPYCKQNYSSFSCAEKLSFSPFQYKRWSKNYEVFIQCIIVHRLYVGLKFIFFYLFIYFF